MKQKNDRFKKAVDSSYHLKKDSPIIFNRTEDNPHATPRRQNHSSQEFNAGKPYVKSQPSVSTPYPQNPYVKPSQRKTTQHLMASPQSAYPYQKATFTPPSPVVSHYYRPSQRSQEALSTSRYMKPRVSVNPALRGRLSFQRPSYQKVNVSSFSPTSNLYQRVRTFGVIQRQRLLETRRVKEASLNSFQRFVSVKSSKAVKLAKREYRQANREYKKVKRQLRTAKKAGDFRRISITKDRLTELKTKKHIAKKVKSLSYRRNGGSVKRKLFRKSYQVNRQLAESAMSDQETLGDIINARQKIRRSKASYHQAKRIARYSGKLGAETTKSAYGLTNRSYNYLKGRGFTRTAKLDRWEVKLAKRIRNFRNRLLHSKAGRVTKGVTKVTKVISQPLRSILSNPLSIKAYFLVFILVMAMSMFMSGGNPMSQSEEDLNKTWLHLSKMDREFSDDTVDYWTNLDDIIFFMNYRYEDFALSDKVDPEPSKHKGITYDLFLGVIWKGLNEDVDNLKTMEDLYAKQDSKVPDIVLSEEELEEYKEFLETSEETGRYLPYQELNNPFIEEDEEATEPLLITKRFGYTSLTEKYEGSVLKAEKGHSLYAVFSGEISLNGKDVTIRTDDAEFTYKSVSQLRVKSGDTIKAGEEIGKVGSDEGQEVFYKKLSDGIIDTWEYVNVGFYFEKVKYNQTTSVIKPIDLSGDVAGRIIQASELIKKYEPKATQNGISAMLGNFWTESNINPKRAEGDFLPPPIGASGNSWDDPAWLSIGGVAIYGKYDNIIHRGLGLGQWTDTKDGSNRHTLLLNYAKSKGKKWYDLELQIDFIFNGDNPYYRQTAKDILTSNDNVDNLTYQFLVKWEGNAGDKLAQRQNNARQVLQILKNPVAGGGTIASSYNFPPSYAGKLKYGQPTQRSMTGQAGSGYPVGQCTWYVYNRLIEIGTIRANEGYGYLGNGQDWVRNLVARGWKFSAKPVVGAVVSTAGGFDGTYPQYGHVGFVEHVNPDGTFLVSELNYAGIKDRIHYRVCSPAHYYTFATRN